MTRNTIYPEQARIISHDSHAEGQYIMRLHAPLVAEHALPGSFIHVQCDPEILMRRPMSIMLTDPKEGSINILYKAHGEGTKQLSKRKVGEIIDLLGPIGTPFKLEDYRKRPLLIGGGVGMPPIIFLAEHIKNTSVDIQPFVIMGSEIPFPFKSRPSQFMVSGIPEGVIAAMPLLEDWGIASRLTSLQGYAGCFEGFVTDLARHWLGTLDDELIDEVEMFCCGPTPMLAAVSQLASEFTLPCQVSLEEYMACAVGGCAGCTVYVETKHGPSMQRVCVDGPVFDAYGVFSA